MDPVARTRLAWVNVKHRERFVERYREESIVVFSHV